MERCPVFPQQKSPIFHFQSPIFERKGAYIPMKKSLMFYCKRALYSTKEHYIPSHEPYIQVPKIPIFNKIGPIFQCQRALYTSAKEPYFLVQRSHVIQWKGGYMSPKRPRMKCSVASLLSFWCTIEPYVPVQKSPIFHQRDLEWSAALLLCCVKKSLIFQGKRALYSIKET